MNEIHKKEKVVFVNENFLPGKGLNREKQFVSPDRNGN